MVYTESKERGKLFVLDENKRWKKKSIPQQGELFTEGEKLWMNGEVMEKLIHGYKQGN